MGQSGVSAQPEGISQNNAELRYLFQFYGLYFDRIREKNRFDFSGTGPNAANADAAGRHSGCYGDLYGARDQQLRLGPVE
ncbi:hypothetical protein SDC9_119707 [bioreactor metagenome]|uniref:Uncharacterized protein n=1 Tax=bioreactor metagenome TaxID=1076179 RepID=A0A645C6W4_9ZZZZ